MFHHVAVCFGQNPTRFEADRLLRPCLLLPRPQGKGGFATGGASGIRREARRDWAARRAEVPVPRTWTQSGRQRPSQSCTEWKRARGGAQRRRSGGGRTQRTVSLPKQNTRGVPRRTRSQGGRFQPPQREVNIPHARDGARTHRDDPREGERRKSRLDRLDEDDLDHEVSGHGGSRRRPGRQRRPFEDLAWGP
jgi:hypothetical protein